MRTLPRATMGAAADRRTFIRVSARATVGLSLVATAACGRPDADATTLEGAQDRWRSLIDFVNKEVPRLLESKTTPGAAVALVKDAKPLWSGGFGVTDRTTNAPVGARTVFELGSVSKTVFAYAVIKACEKGLLGLDTPLTRYTRERYLAGDDRLDLITPRHVLAHQAGFQNWRSKGDALKLQFTPGTGWNYSGEGYHYLQTVLTRVAGHLDSARCKTFEDGLRVCATDFDDYMKANVLVPFGMTSSGYVHQEGMAQPHDGKGQFIRGRVASVIDAARYGSAGQLHSTVDDYARFLIEVLEPRPADAFRLNATSHAEMVRPHVKLTDTLWWALGWAVERHPGMGDIVSHSGDNPGFKAMTAASLTRKAALIIVTNGDRGFEEIITPLLRSEPMREFLPVSV